MLQPRSKVYRPTDHRVVHAIIAAKIAYRTIAGMNADPAAQRGGNTALGPFMRQFSGTLLHGDRHFNASERILFHTKRRWIAEEHYNGVANIFVDRCAVLQRDFRHFGEIVVEELCEIL